jgi:hypothetical protein
MTDTDAHLALAKATYNRCWDLLENHDRTSDDDDDLLATAFASRFHWYAVGTAEQKIVSDWMVSRAAAELGYGELAVHFAQRANEGASEGEFPAWLRASLFEGLARAHATNGDSELRGEFLDLAHRELEQESDDEDRELIAQQIATVPEVL